MDAIDKLIANLKPNSDVGEALVLFADLAASECLVEDVTMPSSEHPPDSALALIDFWESARYWMDGYLGLGLPGEHTVFQTPRLRSRLIPDPNTRSLISSAHWRHRTAIHSRNHGS